MSSFLDELKRSFDEHCSSAKQSAKRFFTTRKLVTNAVLVALHVVLCQIATIRVGNSLSITVSGITEVVAGLLFGPISGGVVGLLGSFINQVLKYGITVTTVLWIVPAGLKGLLCGWYAKAHGYDLSFLQILWVLLVTALVVTSANTNIMIIDATIFGYNTKAAVVTEMAIRYASGALTSVAYMLVTWPLIRQLGRMPGIRGMRE